MKRFILVSFLIIGIAFSSNAQSSSAEKFGYGILFGGNISGIRENPDQLYLGSKLGFQVGGFADYYFSDNVYIKGDLILIRKGAHNEARALGVKIYNDINPMYFQLPIVFGYSFNSTKDININLELGGFVALGIAGKSQSRFTIEGQPTLDRNVSISYFKDTDDEENLYLGNNNRFDYGLRFGIGIDVNKLVFLSANYDLGLANVYNNKMINGNYSKYNYTVGLTLGYRF
ncbi:MAG: PorT family protein [Bacteroidales bacterium]|nr:PorT family protein [Bacteroidales bacterium]